MDISTLKKTFILMGMFISKISDIQKILQGGIKEKITIQMIFFWMFNSLKYDNFVLKIFKNIF